MYSLLHMLLRARQMRGMRSEMEEGLHMCLSGRKKQYIEGF